MHYQDNTDETLVLLTLAGEKDAYEALVMRHQRNVIASATVITRTRFLAEDAAQDAFVTAWMKLNTLQEPSKFGSWVCKIARNCALKMVMRYRNFLPLDVAENYVHPGMEGADPENRVIASDERNELQTVMGNLPERVGQIIFLHYFEGLSVVEIAEKMRISEGTVKWQLHDGRKRIRKDLCAMNETWNDTLVQKVMKKVEELKLWQLKNKKDGFETVYKEVLREVEELPESNKKYYALADVLMRGWWWLPGEKNDALFARIREAAEQGRNEEVMRFIVTREDSKVPEGIRNEFMRDKQIPRLEKAGFVYTLAYEWFCLGYQYYRDNKPELGKEAYDNAEKLVTSADALYWLIATGKQMEQLLGKYESKEEKQYRIGYGIDELRKTDRGLCHWREDGRGEGGLPSIRSQASYIFKNASFCDGRFFDENLAVGERMTASDGTVLLYQSDDETVETPCGVFEHCKLWVIKQYWDYSGCNSFYSYYKPGVGIVKQISVLDGISEVRLLQSYSVAGKEILRKSDPVGGGELLPKPGSVGGEELLPKSESVTGEETVRKPECADKIEVLLPLSVGNTWTYVSADNPEYVDLRVTYRVCKDDPDNMILSRFEEAERKGYDETIWLDMMRQIRSGYYREEGGKQLICDVSYPVERALALAKAPLEQVHARMAAGAAKRIMETDPTFNPDYTALGRWNFFNRNAIRKVDNKVTICFNQTWSMEWKESGGMKSEFPLLHNDIYGILQYVTECVWSDDWKAGVSKKLEFMLWGSYFIQTELVCEVCGPVATKAGMFEDCLKLSLDAKGFARGWDYAGGKMVYYFANGIGIIKCTHAYCDGVRESVYELSAYEGTGTGYFPVADGLYRRYDAIGLTDGHVGAAEYRYMADGEGNIILFSDRIGIREIPAPITEYSAILGEIEEEELWNQGKHNESRLRHDINNFRLITHLLGRQNRAWAAQKKAVESYKYKCRLIESFGEGDAVPRAWAGIYWSTVFRLACASFGDHQIEEGYRYLDKAFEAYERWNTIPDGAELEVGNELIFGGIKLIKGKEWILLPDGTKEPLDYEWMFFPEKDLMYRGVSAKRGWEWFHPVREEERFKEYIKRAKALL